jgi:hypothetical protein
MSFGQNENEVEGLTTRTFHWKTKNCLDLNNPYENNLCIQREINHFTNKNFDWSIIENLPNGNYIIKIHLTLNEDGEILNVVTQSDYPKLNNGLQKTLELFPLRIYSVDKNGTTYANTLSFPITIGVE